MKRFFPILFFSVIVGIFFYPFFIQAKLPVPSDAIDSLYYPYKDFFSREYPRGFPFKNFLITDPLRQQYPWRETVISSEGKFILPLWNPYNGAGEPLMANIQSSAFYPLNILFFVLPFPISWYILIFAQPLLTGMFTYLYLENLKISKRAATLGALAFTFCGFNTAWLEWGTITHTGLWLPLILLSIDKIIYGFNNTKVKKENLTFKNIVWPGILTISLAASLFAGHLQTFFYLYLLSIIYFFTRWSQAGKPKKILTKYLLINSIFLVLTAIQWLSTLQLINLSARDVDQVWRKDGWFIPFGHLAQFIAPDYFGNPSTLNYWGTWNYGELVGYMGILPLIFSLYSVIFRRDKKTLFFSMILLVSLIFAYATPLAVIPFVLKLPFISTAQPTRLIFLIDFCLCVLAALGFDYFSQNKKSIFVPVALIFLALLTLWIPILLKSVNVGISIEHLVTAKHNLILPSIIVFVSSILIFILSRIRQENKITDILFVLCLILVASDLLRFSWKFNVFTDKKLLYPQTKTIKFLKENSVSYPWRFLGVDYVKNQKRIFAPNTSLHDKLYTIDTYNPLLLKKYQDFAAVSEWGFVDIPDFSFNRSIILNNYDSPFIDFMGVKYIVTINNTTSKKLKFLFNEGDTRVYENTSVLPRSFMVYNTEVIKNKKDVAKRIYDKKFNFREMAVVDEYLNINSNKKNISNHVSIVKYEENRIEIDVVTDRAGLLVLSDNYYPTWHAKICGQTGQECKDVKIHLTNYTFRGIAVPQGKNKIIFEDKII